MVNVLADAYREFGNWNIGYIEENHLMIGRLRRIIESTEDCEEKERCEYQIHALETENEDLMGEIEYDRRTAAEIEELHGGGQDNLESPDENGIRQGNNFDNQGEKPHPWVGHSD